VSSSRQRHHRALHSFPTRRSSDLILPAAAFDLTATHGDVGTVVEAFEQLGLLVGRGEMLDRLVDVLEVYLELLALDQQRLQFSRSEEHTSELQSRENLVCRLLLEK